MAWKNGFNAGWQQSAKDEVKMHWAQGHSASFIAALYHCTRSAIIGLVHRNGWETPNSPHLHDIMSPDREKNRKRKRDRAARGGDIKQAAKRNFYEDVIAIRDEEIPLAQRKTLMELTANTCRYPIGDPSSLDFYFCGAPPLEDKPYCAVHLKRCVTTSQWQAANRPIRWDR